MRFVFPGISEPVYFAENTVNSIVIENAPLFLFLCKDIYSQINGTAGYSVLSVNNIPVEMSKNAELISTFVPFSANRKTLINRIISVLEKKAMNDEFYVKTAQLLSEAEKYMFELMYDIPGEPECENISISAFLKAAGIHLREDGDETERISDYMELVRELEKDRLFIFINMRSYFSFEQMTEFIKTVLSHKFRILLIDNKEYPRLENEKRIVIDEDLCEI